MSYVVHYVSLLSKSQDGRFETRICVVQSPSRYEFRYGLSPTGDRWVDIRTFDDGRPMARGTRLSSTEFENIYESMRKNVEYIDESEKRKVTLAFCPPSKSGNTNYKWMIRVEKFNTKGVYRRYMFLKEEEEKRIAEIYQDVLAAAKNC